MRVYRYISSVIRVSCLVQALTSHATDATSEIDVIEHDRLATRVNGAVIRVIEQMHLEIEN